MPKIIKLDKNLSNQIAAGEVVERPASVVKELVENSLDAGATFIKVEIFDGGIKKMIISDNGFGIEKEDLAILGEKHATSKIKNMQDLYNVLTFGFRGEAISSISSVSNLEIQTKYIHENYGNSLKIIGGEKQKIEQISREAGTKIIVEDLFYNTPARLNYIKTSKTEQNHILNYLYEVALAYPNVGFEFFADNKQVFNFKEKEDLKIRIYNIYGNDFSDNLLEINFEMVGITVSGCISDPKINFQNRNRQSLFVNKRPIKSNVIFKAISNAYNRFIPHNTFPAFVLNLEVDPTTIDVNVHPRKLEVRFENEQNIFRAVFHSVEEKLNNVSLINTDNSPTFVPSPNIGEDKKIFHNQDTKFYTGSGTKFKSYSPYTNTKANPNQAKISDAINFSKGILGTKNEEEIFGQNKSVENVENTDLHFTKLGKIIGQIHNSYIMVETTDGMKLFDQHALAERINYEKLVKKDSLQATSTTQGLLFAESIQLTPTETIIINDNADIFREMGFDFELLPGNNLMLNGIPEFVKKEDLKQIFLGILDDVGKSSLKKSKSLEEVKNKIFAYTACRSAIKFGNKLNLFEMNRLLNDSVEVYSSTCPHGRPVVFEISLDELRDKYER